MEAHRFAEEARDDRSLGALVKELSDEGQQLFRQEVQLAKAELGEKLEVYRDNVARLAIGGALVGAAALVLLFAVNRGLTILLATFMSLEVAVWVAPLLLAIVFGLVGRGMIGGARRALRQEGLKPQHTIASLRAEKQWAKDEARELRHG